MSDYESLLDSLRPLAASLEAMNKQAVREYLPMVDGIVRSGSRDVSDRWESEEAGDTNDH